MRGIMSSNQGKKHFCLNTEHTVPGNEYEEQRILGDIASKFQNINLDDQ